MSNTKTITASLKGIGFLDLLALLFIALKLIGVIDWSWLWVLLPLYGPLALIILVVVIVGIVLLVMSIVKKFKEKEKESKNGQD